MRGVDLTTAVLERGHLRRRRRRLIGQAEAVQPEGGGLHCQRQLRVIVLDSSPLLRTGAPPPSSPARRRASSGVQSPRKTPPSALRKRLPSAPPVAAAQRGATTPIGPSSGRC